MRGAFRRVGAIGVVALLLGFGAAGCTGDKHYVIQQVTSTAGASIFVPGYKQIGPARDAASIGSFSDTTIFTIPFIPTQIPSGEGISAVVVWRRNDLNGGLQLIPPIVVDPTTQLLDFESFPDSTFQVEVPQLLDTKNSTITVDVVGEGPFLADGTTKATILIKLVDTEGSPVIGVPLTVTVSGTGNGLTLPTVTDGTGTCTATLTTTTAETKVITVTVVMANTTLILPAITFIALPVPVGPLSASVSTVTASPATVLADLAHSSTITVTLKDARGNPISGQAVSLSATGKMNRITQPTAVTNAMGVATGSIVSNYAETKTITAVAGGVTLANSANVTFVSFGRFLIVSGDSVSNTSTGTAQVYTVDGSLAQPRANGYAVTTTTSSPGAVTVDPQDRFVYQASLFDGSGVCGFTLSSATGTLTKIAGSPFKFGPFNNPDWLAVDPTGRFLYVGDASDAVVTACAINQSTGALTLIGAVTAFGVGGAGNTGNTTALVCDPTGRFLYVGNGNNGGGTPSGPSVVVLSINQTTGALTPVGTPVPAGGPGPGEFLAMDPLGRFVIGVDQGAGEVYLFAIDQTTGYLSAFAEAAVSGPATAVAVDRTGSYAYVGLASGSVVPFAVSLSGAYFYPLSPVPVGAAPTCLAVDPTGKFLGILTSGNNLILTWPLTTAGIFSGPPQVSRVHGSTLGFESFVWTTAATPLSYAPRFAHVASEFDSTAQSYTVDPTGPLTNTSSVGVGASPAWIAVDPGANFCYTANSTDGTLSFFTVDPSTGALTFGGKKTPGTEVFTANPQAVVTDTNGQYVYAPTTDTTGGQEVYSFKIGVGGALTDNGDVALASGASPTGIAIDPTGQFLYVPQPITGGLFFGPGTVGSFPIALIDGTLGSRTDSTIDNLSTAATSIAIHPSGRFAYVSDDTTGGDTIQACSISATDGSLTQIGGPVTTGFGRKGLAVDPLGAFVFCANSGDDTISVYALDTTFLSATEGQITGEVTGSPVSVSPGSVPISCAVDPTGSFLYVTCQGSEGGSAVQVYSISRSGPTPLTLVSTATPTTSGPTSIALSRSLK